MMMMMMRRRRRMRTYKNSVSDQNVKQVQLVWFFRRLNSGVFPFWRFHWCRSPIFLQPWAVDLGVPGTILVASKSLLGSRIHIIHHTALGYIEQFHPTSQKWREQIPIHRIYGYLHIVCVKWPPVFSGFGSSCHAPKRSGQDWLTCRGLENPKEPRFYHDFSYSNFNFWVDPPFLWTTPAMTALISCSLGNTGSLR